MQFKKKAKIETDDFYYDLFDGGYIKPDKVLENKRDVQEVLEAIKIIKDFKDAAEKQGVLQYS